jgi:hypothetical protein
MDNKPITPVRNSPNYMVYPLLKNQMLSDAELAMKANVRKMPTKPPSHK